MVDCYPRPKFDRLIEPFAGAAKYALKYFDKDVLIVDKYKTLVDVWLYLQQATPNDLLSLPKPVKGQSLLDFKSLSPVERDFLGFLVCNGLESPRLNVGSFEVVNVERDLKRIAKSLFKIRHWKIVHGTFQDIENVNATWFVDPPYQYGGEHYKESNKNLDFPKLAEWCQNRNGQVIVCENTKADWLPFLPVKKMSGSKHKTTEAIWSNEKTAFHNVQLEIF